MFSVIVSLIIHNKSMKADTARIYLLKSNAKGLEDDFLGELVI